MTYPIIDQILNSSMVIDQNGEEVPLRGNISRFEGDFLRNLIANDPSITHTLEVGCAFALSALFICEALQDRPQAHHILVDPNQYSDYQGIGILNLERAGVDFYKLVEAPSEIALPDLLNEAPGAFDLIFIDGLHSFDQVALDFYYANRLLRVGGYIVFDDCSYPSVTKVLTYALQYPAYSFHSQVKDTSQLKKLLRFCSQLIPRCAYTYLLPQKLTNLYQRLRFTSMAAIQKTAEDDRNWDWFVDF